MSLHWPQISLCLRSRCPAVQWSHDNQFYTKIGTRDESTVQTKKDHYHNNNTYDINFEAILVLTIGFGVPLIGQFGSDPFVCRSAIATATIFPLLLVEKFDRIECTSFGDTVLQLTDGILYDLIPKNKLIA